MTQTPLTRDMLLEKARELGAQARTPAGRAKIATHLEATIRRSKIGDALLRQVTLMYAYFRDPQESWKPKLLIGGALLYFITPADFIPDIFAAVGYTDDLAVLLIVGKIMDDVLRNYAKRRAARDNAPIEAQ